ncbi:MAG: DUF3251 domain-containing protein [Bacteroidales bacterium]|nr:DUF3251 domain-containing protein [Bacteroidales bacterium]
MKINNILSYMFFTIFIITIITGCDNQSKIEELNTEIKNLKEEISFLYSYSENNEDIRHYENILNNFSQFNMDNSSGYSSIKSTDFSFLYTINNYSEESREISFQIGNINSIQVNKSKICFISTNNLSNELFKTGNNNRFINYKKWKDSFGYYEVQIPGIIYPFQWNEFNISLPSEVNKNKLIFANIKVENCNFVNALDNLSQIEMRLIPLETPKNIVMLDPYSKGFQKIETENGNLFVSVEKIEKYLNGYNLFLNIGNPNNSDFVNVKYVLSYGVKRPIYKDYKNFAEYEIKHNEWKKSLRQKEFNISEKLYAGKWNIIKLTIPDAKADEISYIDLSASVNSVMLKY